MPKPLDRVMEMLGYAPAKASSGIGAFWMSTEPSISMFSGNQQKMMKDAQEVAQSNRWIRASERVISQAFGTVDWHLENEEGETVTDESNPLDIAIRDLFERPYKPTEGDPRTATPKTRAGLWSLTSRHEGVCGSGFWYLDQTSVQAGVPVSQLYINPARMTPAGTANRLVGWVLDADNRGGGTPLDSKYVLHFTLEEPDDGFFPPGLVETAMSSVNVTKYADRHAMGSFASGGKLPGVFSPKGEAGILPPDVFQQLEKDLRAANEHPDATRRSVILRGPIDFTPTAATPEQLDLVAVQNMSRDDILGLWGVPLSQLGIAAPAGLNSGNTKSYDEAALWQKAVSPRLRRFRETIQFEFLDLIAERTGRSLQIIIDEPTFDDDAPKYDLAVKAINLPLRNVERRALIGLDPLGDPVLDNAIWMPATIVESAMAPEAAKAKLVPGLRRAVDNLAPKMKRDIQAFLAAQQKEVTAKVRANAAHLTAQPNDARVWWNQSDWDKRLAKVLTPYATEIANISAQRAEGMLKPHGKAAFDDLVGNKVLQKLLSRVGLRIKGINETTRDKIAAAIKEGIEAGDGAAQLGDRVEAAAAFDEYRAELIARTESAQALNESQIETFREYGVEKVVAIDGDEDEECAARDGQEFDLDDALAIQDHPNGTLDWSPVV
jgi:phage portal protein BeeE